MFFVCFMVVGIFLTETDEDPEVRVELLYNDYDSLSPSPTGMPVVISASPDR